MAAATAMRFSPSQLSTWRMCRRKWYYASVLRLPQPEQTSTQLGTRVHAVLEKWLAQEEYTVPDDLTKILKPVFEDEFYQSLVGKVNVEAHANSPLGAYQLNGRIDVFWQDPHDPTHWYVMDHKTSKDPSKWAKSVGEAEVDPQTVCYSYDIFEKFGAERVTTIYAYIGTQKHGPVQFVYAHHTRESMERLLRELEYDLACMERVRADPQEDSVPRTTSACWSFGGCPFKERCFSSSSTDTSPSEEAESTVSKEAVTMNINDLLLRNNKKPALVPAPSPEASTPVQSTALPEVPVVQQPAPAPAPVEEPPPVAEKTAPAPTPEPTAEPAAEKPKKRGRPKKEAAPAPAPSAPETSEDSIVLVGALPMGEHCPTIEQFLIEDTDLVTRYEAATREGYLEDQYGKGVRLLSAELIASLKAGTVSLPRFTFIAKDSPFAKYLVGGLKGVAGVALIVGV